MSTRASLRALCAAAWPVLIVVWLVVGTTAPVGGWATTLTLADAVARGLASHPDIVKASHDVRKAELELAAALARVTLPSAQLELRPFTLAQGADFPGTTQGSLVLGVGLATGTNLSLELNPSYTWSVGDLSLSWRLSVSQRYDPTRPTPSAARSITDAEAQVATAQTAQVEAREDAVLSIIQSYASMLASATSLAEAHRSLVRAESTLVTVKADMADGQASKLQRLDAEIALRDAEIAVRKRATSHASAIEQFSRTVCLEGPIELERSGNVSPELLLHVESLLARDIPELALARSSAVRNATEAVATAEDRIRSLQVGGWPVPLVSVTWSEGGWRVALSMSVSLFAPDRAAQRDLAQAELELAHDRLASAWGDAERTILQARGNLEQASEAVAVMKMEREKLALERAATEIRLEAGLLGPSDWESFLGREERFESDHEQLLLSLLQAYFRYQQALGVALDPEGMMR